MLGKVLRPLTGLSRLPPGHSTCGEDSPVGVRETKGYTTINPTRGTGHQRTLIGECGLGRLFRIPATVV
jgi:hypothetical protein